MSNLTLTTTLMTNVTSLMANQTTPIPSLDELLDRLGFQTWEIVVNTFIFPLIDLIGIALCSFSLWIFSRPSFEDPIFFYYKLLCFVNIIHLSHNIPFGVLFTPKYFPMINTFASSIYNIYYSFIINFLFHFEDVLQMAILLHKMKLFVPLVKKHFTSSPQIISLALFLICLLIDLPYAFSIKIVSFGEYFYFDSDGLKHIVDFYYFTSSDFSQTLFGQILIGLTSLFLNSFLTLLVGIILNIVSYIKYKIYSNQRKRELEHLQMSSINNRPTTSREMEQQRRRQRTEQNIEKNMLRMSLTLCTISILLRFLYMSSIIYYFLFNSFFNSLLTEIVVNLFLTFAPTVSSFIFYSFNKMFRDETKNVFQF